tara:strand:- start:2467 stop:2634 length:168 start_codon:yes stop_codon:yes gene_type:complete
MIIKRLSFERLFLPISPAVLVALFNKAFTLVSNSISLVLPVELSNTPKCNWSIKS